MTTKQGIWICVTGIDGTGKTSLCSYLTSQLPGATFMKIPYFDWLRDMLKLSGKNTPLGDVHTDTLLFSACNRLEMDLIRERLQQASFLVTQRSWLDNFPYRKVQGLSYVQSKSFQQPDNFLFPDVIIFLKTDYKTAFDRIRGTGGDKYEEEEFMRRLQKEFDAFIDILPTDESPVRLPHSTQVFTLDAAQSLEELQKQAKSILARLGYCSGPK